MESLTIKVENISDLRFLQELLRKFQFVKSIDVNTNNTETLKERYKNLPISWAKEKPSVKDFTNVLQGRKISIEEIRKKAWKRN